MKHRKGNGLNLTGKKRTQIIMIIMICYDLICADLKNLNYLRSIQLCK